jgi:hypothetical protein
MLIIDIAFRHLWQLTDQNWRQLEQSRSAEDTMIVGCGASALTVAREAESHNISLILVVDNQTAIAGIVSPEWITRQIEKNYINTAATPNTFEEALQILIEDEEQRKRNYHNEWLNQHNLQLYWCEKGRHHTRKKNCPKH